MSQQLVKKGANGGYSNVMPKSWIEAIKDKNTGKTLVEILQSFNMYFLPYDGNSTSTRCLVPTMLRKKGLWITYVKYDDNVYTEWYAADEIDDTSWGDSSNWRIGNNTLVGDITISSNGNWVINGTETEFKAVGEKGNTPLIRIANNRLQVSYDLGDTYIDVTDNPVYTKFRWLATTGDTQANNVGRIQASTDEGKTWTNMSNDFTNNLHIKKYIGVNESLPTSGIAEGTIYAKGPYYDEGDTSNSNPIYRLWVYAWKGNTLAWQDNGEFTSISAGVVQETGDSETEVMSQKAVSGKLSELGSEMTKLKINAGIINSSNVTRTLENYKIFATGAKIVGQNSGTSVLFFKIGESKPFEIEAQTSVIGVCVILVDSISPQSYKSLLNIDRGGIYTYKGVTTSELQYVAIQIDNGTQYSCVYSEKYTGTEIKRDIEKVLKNVEKNSYTIEGEAELKRNLANYKLVNNSTRPLVANTTTDVVFLYIGKNTKFNIRGVCSVDGCYYALSDSVSPSTWLFKEPTNGTYELMGETTEELEYVAVTIDKGSDFSCSILKDIKEVVTSISNISRKSIFIHLTDSQINILNKMIDAYNKGNCDVYFERGTYIFDEVYLYMLNTLGWSWTMELPIGNNCRYYFNGSTLVSNQPNGEYSESRNVIGCKAGKSNKMDFELYDGELVNNGGTYCVHDECSRGTSDYTHKYFNMIMKYNHGENTEYLSKCIGGGAGVNGYVVIDNCIFENNNQAESTEDVSWHGLINSENPISFKCFVSNSFFSRQFRVGSSFKETDEIFVKYSNNSQAKEPSIESYARKYIWLS